MSPINKKENLLPIGTLLRTLSEDMTSTESGLYETIHQVTSHKKAFIFNVDGPTKWVDIITPLSRRLVAKRTFFKVPYEPFYSQKIINSTEDPIEIPKDFETV